LRDIQEVSILPTSRTQEATPSPQEQATFSLLEKARNPSSLFWPQKELNVTFWKKEKIDSDTKVDEANQLVLIFIET